MSWEEYRQNKYYCKMCMNINCDGCGVKSWLNLFEKTYGKNFDI